MSLMAKDKGGGDFPLIDPGTHQAVCYGVVDLGTHENTIYQTKSQKVCVMWELPDQRIEYDKDGLHHNIARTISKIYTLSINEAKSNLGKDLVSWRGKPFTEEEKQGFDIFSILEANCLLQIIHVQKNGKTYANISAIVKLPKNMQRLKPESAIIQYSMADNGFEIPGTVPEWMQKLIKKSEEFVGGSQPVGDEVEGENVQVPPTEDDDIPF